jgi:hypothetical protein
MFALAFVLYLPLQVAPREFTVPDWLGEMSVDGSLAEEGWQKALRIPLEYEVRPGENITPPVRTELLLLSGEKYIYIGFICEDPNPKSLRARYSDRDGIFGGDLVGIVFDTFNDGRRAYEFMCNPLGVQGDALNDDLNGDYNTSWNALWRSAGKLTSTGWVVEMEIPYAQMRFTPGSQEKVWGFDAFRSYPRVRSHHIGVFPRDRNVRSYLAQSWKLKGFQTIRGGRNLEIVPAVVGLRKESPASETPAEDEVEMGASVRWALTPDTVFNAALNPDFSTVEADELQLGLNQPFSLFFPETRPFFLEGADFFTTPVDLVHTRTLADPLAATKITATRGRHGLALLLARDEQTAILHPGPTRSEAANFAMESDAHIARYRLDFGRNSSAGVLLESRQGKDYHNRLISLDATLAFTASDTLTLQAVRSDTRYSEAMRATFGQEQRDLQGNLFFARFQHRVRDWSILATLQGSGDEVRADLGYLPRVGTRQAELQGQRNWYFAGESFLHQLSTGLTWQQKEQTEGELLERSWDVWLEMAGRYQTEISIWTGSMDKVHQGLLYRDLAFYGLELENQPLSALVLSLELEQSQWIDFAHNRPGDWHLQELTIEARPGRHLQVESALARRRLQVAGGTLFRADQAELRLVHYQNPRFFVRAIFQYTDLHRDPALYAETVARQTRDLGSQLLVSYKLDVQTLAFLGYSDQWFSFDRASLDQQERALFLKLSYSWLP